MASPQISEIWGYYEYSTKLTWNKNTSAIERYNRYKEYLRGWHSLLILVHHFCLEDKVVLLGEVLMSYWLANHILVRKGPNSWHSPPLVLCDKPLHISENRSYGKKVAYKYQEKEDGLQKKKKSL